MIRNARDLRTAWRWLTGAGAALCLVTHGPSGLAAGPAADAERRVRDIVYDYAVTSYCGTLTPEVEAGFRAELAEITERRGLDAEQAKSERIAGWVAADKEWSNRGLGGFRAWCRGEGVDAAQRFLTYQPSDH